MAHSFEVDIAVKYGVNAAILLNNIYFWCQKNKANKHNFFDGSYWTYNSRSAFAEIFPYLSERQIKTALDKLIDDGVIKTGCYNKNIWDKSLWYTLTDKGWSIMQERRIDIAEMSNRLDEDVRPIPDSKTTDNKTTNNKPDKSLLCTLSGFIEFWKVYPNKVKKSCAITAWKSGKCESIADTIIADVKLRISTEWKDQDMNFIPHPTTYLHQRRWEDETPPTERRNGTKEQQPITERVYKDADYENDW